MEGFFAALALLLEALVRENIGAILALTALAIVGIGVWTRKR
jgi:hypothetical protein